MSVFQPHRYSRTQDLFEDLAKAFHDAQVLIITDIYAAGEQKIPGIDARSLAEAAREHGHRNVHYVAEMEEILPALRDIIRSGDLLLFLGAGDISRLAQRYVEDRGGSAD